MATASVPSPPPLGADARADVCVVGAGIAGLTAAYLLARQARHYTDWQTPGDVSSPDEVKPGTGAALRRGLRKLAVYRDERGGRHECSAVGPHLGCVVHWNGAGKTWGCPCHGSRFGPEGRVINGPANRGLAPVESKGQEVRGGDGVRQVRRRRVQRPAAAAAEAGPARPVDVGLPRVRHLPPAGVRGALGGGRRPDRV